MSDKKKYLIVVAGPTAVGKTALSIKIAQHFKTEIISADSRQFYKQMSIGTAKPNPFERSLVKHHFIDCLDITEDLPAGQFEKLALQTLEDLFKKHNCVVLTGGSGLFINALINGVDDLPSKNEKVREELNQLLNKQGIESLQKLLKVKDPEYFNQVDINNPHRLIRALEVCISSNKPYSQLRRGSNKNRPFTTLKIALNLDRKVLYERINKRVDLMITEGLVKEVKDLYPFKNLNALRTVGYKEIFDFLEEKISFEEAIELIKKNTRNYAKRQLTWFRKDKEYKWFLPEAEDEIIEYLKNCMYA